MRSLLLVLLMLALAGCEAAFDPFVDEAEGFAVYGFLDARADLQRVRLQPIGEREADPALGDARLTSAALSGGEPIVWNDALIPLDDGSVGLLFTAAFQPEPGTTYRLEVRGADERVQTVDVPIPSQPSLDPLQANIIGGFVSQRLVIGSAVQPSTVEVIYTARRQGGTPQDIVIGNEADPISNQPGFDVLVGLSRDGVRVRGVLGAAQGEPVELLGLRLRYNLVDANRVEVAGGFGTVGVAAGFESAWVLEPEIVEALGYLDGQGGR